MKSTSLQRLLTSLLLFAVGVAHAEDGCPSGQIPHSGTDPNSCGPIPPGYYNNKPQQSPSRWVDHWGAIATYAPTGILGTSTNLPGQSQAEQSALADCQSKGGTTCKIQLSYRNQCAVVVVGDKGYNATPGATMDLANQAGMKVCSDADTNCHVYYSACSLPVRVQ
ncbi:MAG TPA: DUF4189 domain-containing protein [Rhodanobacter sp.]|jgi:hypothetical protein|nr:DUF4189 domain-containing protein [Rhodanobacter sp.]